MVLRFDFSAVSNIFGDSHVTEIAQTYNIDMIAKLPIDPKIAEACDKGTLESFAGNLLDNIAVVLEKVTAAPKSKNRRFECEDCGHIWEVEPCTAGGMHGYEIPCPKCGSMNKIKIGDDGQRHMCGGGHHEHGGGCCCH
jgi:phage FluMu protein Com